MRTMLMVIVVTLMPVLGVAQDIAKGFEAYEAGDFATALKEWKPLADQGNASAQHLLGLMYNRGDGVAQDYTEAAKWFRLAADQGEVDAQYMLANMYNFGEGVPQDYREAMRWYRLAAAQGKAVAQVRLGNGYMLGTLGTGGIEDIITAKMWYILARENGFGAAGDFGDAMTEIMTPEQVAEAQRRASVCMASNYQDCD